MHTTAAVSKNATIPVMSVHLFTVILFWLLAAACILVLPAPAFANIAASYLDAAVITSFTLGTLLIGVLEGILIALLFRRPLARCLVLMLVGNYLSGMLGVWRGIGSPVADPFSQVGHLGTFVARYISLLPWTMLVEALFVLACFSPTRRERKDKVPRRPFAQKLLALALSQMVSYVLLGWFLFSRLDGLWRLQPVAPVAMHLPSGLHLYAIAPGGAVVALDPPSFTPRRIAGPLSGYPLRLVMTPQSAGQGEPAHLAVSFSKDWPNPFYRMQEVGFTPIPEERDTTPPQGHGPYADAGPKDGGIPFLGERDSSWSYSMIRDDGFKLVAANRETGERITLGGKSPAMRYSILDPVQLPGGLVIFTLVVSREPENPWEGARIIVLDPGRHEIALIGAGWGVLPVMAAR